MRRTGNGITWFRLGDKDLALHIYRTQALSKGLTLSEVYQGDYVSVFDIKTQIVPMSDNSVQTFVDTNKRQASISGIFLLNIAVCLK